MESESVFQAKTRANIFQLNWAPGQDEAPDAAAIQAEEAAAAVRVRACWVLAFAVGDVGDILEELVDS